MRVGPVSLQVRRRAVLVALASTVLLALAALRHASASAPRTSRRPTCSARLSGAGTPYDLVVLDLRLPGWCWPRRPARPSGSPAR
ncbi:hypothetical protein [Micromonospora sp. 4G55]|uniref:hypothetical protein n=1 Tax=Micromonospora sp. 4G55 TaxID=2806102 RepID=UPI001EE3D2D5|nr:hypothetical protein [Micromonospora sp. 4G55]